MEDLNDKITGGTLTAAEWNQVPSEIQNVIESLGISLSSGDLNQLGKAIAGYVANGDFYTDSGAADAYVLSVVGLKQAPTAYTDGMRVRFITSNPNTGASTVNVAGLGVKNVKLSNGSDPAAGDISGSNELTFDFANDRFEVAQPISSLFRSTGQTITSAGQLVLPHGLGVEPKFITYILQNTSAEGNYTSGDRVAINFNGSGSLSRSNSPLIDATNITIRFTDETEIYVLQDKTTGASFGIDNSKWDLYVIAIA